MYSHGAPSSTQGHSYSDDHGPPSAVSLGGVVGLGGHNCPSRSAETYPLSVELGISVGLRSGTPPTLKARVEYTPPGSCTHPSRSSMHRSSPRAASGSVGWRVVVSSPSRLALGVGSESYLSGEGVMVATPDVHAGRSGVTSALSALSPPASCSYASCSCGIRLGAR